MAPDVFWGLGAATVQQRALRPLADLMCFDSRRAALFTNNLTAQAGL